ncbi:hypothetical protein V6N11_052308 [Hibiscus sabdariffa]|uniref:Uncharacterized protein n=1 Tax=Hibiscus sabdariffa TaxID=183260 RepID=A0ABR2U9R7_9ROSI
MEQLFGVSVTQGILKFTLVMDCSQNASVGYNQYECADEMTSENITFTCGETNEKWQEIWNDSSVLLPFILYNPMNMKLLEEEEAKELMRVRS